MKYWGDFLIHSLRMEALPDGDEKRKAAYLVRDIRKRINEEIKAGEIGYDQHMGMYHAGCANAEMTLESYRDAIELAKKALEFPLTENMITSVYRTLMISCIFCGDQQVSSSYIREGRFYAQEFLKRKDIDEANKNLAQHILSFNPESVNQKNQSQKRPEPVKNSNNKSSGTGCVLSIIGAVVFMGTCMVFFHKFNNRGSKSSTSTSIQHSDPSPRPTEPTSVKEDTHVLSEAAAMEMVYGVYDTQMKWSSWDCASEGCEGYLTFNKGSSTVYSKALMMHPFHSNGLDHVFLTTQSPERDGNDWYSCHGCGAVLGTALFRFENEKWRMITLDRNLGFHGSYGEILPTEIQKFGKDNYGISVTEAWMGQGLSSSSVIYYGLVNDSIIEIARFNLGESTEDYLIDNKTIAYSWTAKIDFTPGSDPKWDNIVVTVTGERPMAIVGGGEEVQAINEVWAFYFLDGKYIQAE